MQPFRCRFTPLLSSPLYDLSITITITIPMESSNKLKLINQPIQQLSADKRNKEASGADGLPKDNYEQLHLSKLLTELESIKGDDDKLEQSELSGEEEVNSPAIGVVVSEHEKDGQVDEIVKEHRKVRRQNLVTHCLLSALIVLTVAWQLSEVSLILKLKDGLNHPFRSFGSMLSGMLKGPSTNNGQDAEKKKSDLVPLKILELPHIDLGSDDEDHP